jgi:hypothetical protein
MTASIARYLKDFGEPISVPPILVDVGDFDYAGESLHVQEEPIAAPVDLAAERAEAHAMGYDEGRAEAQRVWEEQRQELLKAHADEIAALRERYEADIASTIERKMGEAALIIAQAVGNQAARVLAPVVEEALISKAVDDLAALLRAAISDGDVATVTVRGPLSLFEMLQAAFSPEQSAQLRHVEAPDVDISAEIGDAALVTRLSAWSARLKEVLA